jgi:hypothetical protein
MHMKPLHRLWQVLPHRLRREALFGGMELVAPRPAAAHSVRTVAPFVIAGFFGAPTG